MSKADRSIVVRHVSKTFTLRYHRTLKQMSVAMARQQELSDSFLAVNDVSFTVNQGESIGLMGLNGSGKSTLLKMVNGIMRPDRGKVLTRGRIAGLIATGAGFHPQLTGRDNVYLNAAILGMSEAETRRKFDDIVEFADIGRFLDSPVGHYSSGMFARLGFAVAIHVDADVFLADEVLAVGDRPFKRKCLAKMQEIRESGTTLFYVSHATASVRRMCDRVLVLEKGRLAFDGDVDEGIKFLAVRRRRLRGADRGRRRRGDGRRHLTAWRAGGSSERRVEPIEVRAGRACRDPVAGVEPVGRAPLVEPVETLAGQVSHRISRRVARPSLRSGSSRRSSISSRSRILVASSENPALDGVSTGNYRFVVTQKPYRRVV